MLRLNANEPYSTECSVDVAELVNPKEARPFLLTFIENGDHALGDPDAEAIVGQL
jgi:hypothetical protein